MPAYPWLDRDAVDAAAIAAHMRALRRAGRAVQRRRDREAAEGWQGKTELDALVAYLQVLGTAVK